MINDLLTSKEELEKEYDINIAYIDKCDERSCILGNNTSKTNAACILATGSIAFIPVAFLILYLYNLLPITSSIITYILAPLSLATSAGIGAIFQRISNAKQKKKMQRFTDAKTNAEILEEQINYDMEVEKTECKNDILVGMYKAIEGKENILRKYNGEIEFKDENIGLTKEEQLDKKERLEKAYNDGIKELDILTSQNFLQKRFHDVRDTKFRKEKLHADAALISLPFVAIIGSPISFAITSSIVTWIDFIIRCAVVFSPALLVTPLVTLYLHKLNKDQLKAFKNINSKLGENALKENIDSDYETSLDKKITTKKNEVVELGLSLKSATRALENLEENKNKDSHELDIEKELSEVMPYLYENTEEYGKSTKESEKVKVKK